MVRIATDFGLAYHTIDAGWPTYLSLHDQRLTLATLIDLIDQSEILIVLPIIQIHLY